MCAELVDKNKFGHRLKCCQKFLCSKLCLDAYATAGTHGCIPQGLRATKPFGTRPLPCKRKRGQVLHEHEHDESTLQGPCA